MKYYKVWFFSLMKNKYINKKPFTTGAPNKNRAIMNYYNYIENKYNIGWFDLKDALQDLAVVYRTEVIKK